MHFCVIRGTLRDKEHVHCGIIELGQFCPESLNVLLYGLDREVTANKSIDKQLRLANLKVVQTWLQSTDLGSDVAHDI